MKGKHAKKKHKKQYSGFSFKKFAKSVVILAVTLCLTAVSAVAFIILAAPNIDPDNIYDSLPQHSIIYDREGRELETIYQSGQGQRTNITVDELSPYLADAFVAIEDKTFWDHHGFNFIRIFGAIWESIKTGGSIGGTSTITQQLARNIYLEEEKSDYNLVRKIKEAYYALELEQKLTKEQILEAYLNTIYLGNQANGVQAAAWNYFHKDVGELNLAESAMIAALAQLPDAYAPVKQEKQELVDPETLDVITYYGEYVVYYNDSYQKRQKLILDNMLDQEKITSTEYYEALSYDIFAALDPYQSNAEDISSYFADYVRKQVIQDLIAEGFSEEKAVEIINRNGLRIKTTLDLDMQQKAEELFAANSNFPKPAKLNLDADGNVRDKSNDILMYNMDTYFDADGTFWLTPEEYQFNDDGSLVLFTDRRLVFSSSEHQGITDVNIGFKTLYRNDSETGFISIDGGSVALKSEYKMRNDDGGITVSSQFFKDNSEFFRWDEAGNPGIPSSCYTLQQAAAQPQGAMVIMDHQTGEIMAMIGGRNLEGKMLYNRATGTRPPGSAIKPISVYAPALQSTLEGTGSWTAASIINDSPLTVDGKSWPKNWYKGYNGRMTLRKSIEQSVNTSAVKVLMDIGVETSVDSLTKLGVTSIVSEGSVNDLNAAALALGGMTYGISPLEMTAAYSAFPNEGVYIEPVCYTSVTNKNGDIVLLKRPETVQAMDPGVAFIMTDMLRTTVTNGIASHAAIGSQPVAGKTGTTTDNYDAWFVGFTPYYSAAVWIGNDLNIELDLGSKAAAVLWSKTMKEIHEDLPKGSFQDKPSNVVASGGRGEYYLKGTQPAVPSTAYAVEESQSQEKDEGGDTDTGSPGIETDPNSISPDGDSGPGVSEPDVSGPGVLDDGGGPIGVNPVEDPITEDDG